MSSRIHDVLDTETHIFDALPVIELDSILDEAERLNVRASDQLYPVILCGRMGLTLQS